MIARPSSRRPHSNRRFVSTRLYECTSSFFMTHPEPVNIIYFKKVLTNAKNSMFGGCLEVVVRVT